MRTLLVAALAGASALGGVMVAQTTAAQPYYAAPARVYEPGYRYDEFGRPYYDDGYRPGYYVEGGSVVGPALVEGYARVPVDRFGPDPNGMIAADGHRIKCKLTDDYSARLGHYYTHRVCD